MVYGSISAARRYAYRRGYLASQPLPVPVVIVGNIVVGGSGKTPLLLHLCQFLQQAGYHPGIISRGYGGKARQWPQRVWPDSDPVIVGDEPVLLAMRSTCPVMVGPDRVAAAQALLAAEPCDILLSDDGLQHYALERDIEISIVDGKRGYGNARLLPAGPLREPLRRLQSVDFVVSNGAALPGAFTMRLSVDYAYVLEDPSRRRPLTNWIQQEVYALAGIAHPQRFFSSLERYNMDLQVQAFPDHYAYQAQDISRFRPDSAKPLLMTEKDAVKCRHLGLKNIWVVPAQVSLDTDFEQQLLNRLAVLQE